MLQYVEIFGHLIFLVAPRILSVQLPLLSFSHLMLALELAEAAFVLFNLALWALTTELQLHSFYQKQMVKKWHFMGHPTMGKNNPRFILFLHKCINVKTLQKHTNTLQLIHNVHKWTYTRKFTMSKDLFWLLCLSCLAVPSSNLILW